MTKYQETLEQMWELNKELFQLSENPVKELGRIASTIRVYSRQVIKLENLKKRVEAAVQNKDLAALRALQYSTAHIAEEKAYKELWDKVSSEYDAMVASVKKDTVTLATSQELYENSRKWAEEAEAKQLEEMLAGL